jgi:hypothetical protein
MLLSSEKDVISRFEKVAAIGTTTDRTTRLEIIDRLRNKGYGSEKKLQVEPPGELCLEMISDADIHKSFARVAPDIKMKK